MPGGKRCYFQVLTTEGIRTGKAQVGPFVIARKPRQTTIIEPAAKSLFRPGEFVKFIGESFSPDGGSAPATELEWSSDRDGVLGTGHYFSIHTLRVGWHTITLRVPDGLGGKTVSRVNIRIGIPPLAARGRAGARTAKSPPRGAIRPARGRRG